MDIIEDKKFLDPNFINIKGLTRTNWDMLWHPNGEFLKTLEFSGIQVYVLEGTIYGCFINKTKEDIIETQWFGHHLASVKNYEGKIVPSSTLDLYQVLDLCSPEKLDGVLFNLDILS
jgi:hypothetical protein